MIEQLEAVLAEARTAIAAAADAAAVDALKVKYVGRRGVVSELMRGLGALSAEERPRVGQTANQVKGEIDAALAAAAERLTAAQTAAVPPLDVTLPGRRRRLGRKHPISLVMDDAVAVFRRMGFIVAEGPEVETIWHNFDALNTPPDHPSREPKDTFYFPDGRILRTQTSPVQIRTMEKQQPPVRIVCPGRVYRRDTPDATHGMNFHQIEGLYVDRNVSLADLKGTLAAFAAEMLGSDTKIRFRPHFFPFTEPSVECDFSCIICGGKGCRVCKQSGWLEIAGAGMVNPKVFEAVKYDPAVWTGYAFGMGIERIAMIRYAIPDIRFLYENDTRFLHQF
ncbi:MAG: phenylalanine--tRNA ligase subunit alpha [Lentisphaeria bacterium]